MSEGRDQKSEDAKARAAALRLLARRARTRADLMYRLRRKGFSSAAIEATLDELARAGYVDDLEYARERMDDLLRRSRYGSLGLVSRLVKNGIEPELAETAVAERLREVDEREWARQLATERLAELPELDADTTRRRLFSYLSRRGFTHEDIIVALEEVLHAEP